MRGAAEDEVPTFVQLGAVAALNKHGGNDEGAGEQQGAGGQ